MQPESSVITPLLLRPITAATHYHHNPPTRHHPAPLSAHRNPHLQLVGHGSAADGVPLIQNHAQPMHLVSGRARARARWGRAHRAHSRTCRLLKSDSTHEQSSHNHPQPESSLPRTHARACISGLQAMGPSLSLPLWVQSADMALKVVSTWAGGEDASTSGEHAIRCACLRVTHTCCASAAQMQCTCAARWWRLRCASIAGAPSVAGWSSTQSKGHIKQEIIKN